MVHCAREALGCARRVWTPLGGHHVPVRVDRVDRRAHEEQESNEKARLHAEMLKRSEAMRLQHERQQQERDELLQARLKQREMKRVEDFWRELDEKSRRRRGELEASRGLGSP